MNALASAGALCLALLGAWGCGSTAASGTIETETEIAQALEKEGWTSDKLNSLAFRISAWDKAFQAERARRRDLMSTALDKSPKAAHAPQLHAWNHYDMRFESYDDYDIRSELRNWKDSPRSMTATLSLLDALETAREVAMDEEDRDMDYRITDGLEFGSRLFVDVNLPMYHAKSELQSYAWVLAGEMESRIEP